MQSPPIQTKVSIIVPVYNAENFLERCVQSIKLQTSQNWEAIFVNDGSTDNSLQLLYELISDDSRFLVINKPNAGPSSARNAGLSATNAQYVTFLDADDVLECNFIEQTLSAVLATGCDLVATGRSILNSSYDIVRNERLPISGLLPFEPKVYFRDVIVAPWSKLYRKDIINKYNIRFPEDMKVAEDFVFSALYAIRIKNYYSIPDSLYKYCSGNQLSLTHQFARGDMPLSSYKLNIEAPWRILQKLKSESELNKRIFSDFVFEIYKKMWLMYNTYRKSLPLDKKKEITYFFKQKHKDFVNYIGFFKRLFLLERFFLFFRIVWKLKYYYKIIKKFVFTSRIQTF